eukprot:TRINITY_DN38725_c0_g1_i1.p1 TRINITY_DN38725_c0_g1~~TRINITY_DN38725_c0_g1_i1.p1  ORF type:complete len:686 (+),score=89.33 TRINITY_DN38725_c0_g1_i1:463-2520(+)
MTSNREEEEQKGSVSVEFGEPCSLHYRVLFRHLEGSAFSPWHDIPLHAGSGQLNVVCLTPPGQWTELEVAQEEPFTPLRFRSRQGKPAHFEANCGAFSFVFLPQTWSDPSSSSEELPGWGRLQYGEGPLEAIDVSRRVRRTGDIYGVKLLGAFAVIAGRSELLSWKLLCVAADDELAASLNDVADLVSVLPGFLEGAVAWLYTCHCDIETDPANEFGNYGQPFGASKVLEIVAEANASWQLLHEESSHGPRSPMEVELRTPGSAARKSGAAYEGLWSPYTQWASNLQISSSMPASSPRSRFALDRAWAESAADVDPPPQLDAPPSRVHRHYVQAEQRTDGEKLHSAVRSSAKVRKFLSNVKHAVRGKHSPTPNDLDNDDSLDWKRSLTCPQNDVSIVLDGRSSNPQSVCPSPRFGGLGELPVVRMTGKQMSPRVSVSLDSLDMAGRCEIEAADLRSSMKGGRGFGRSISNVRESSAPSASSPGHRFDQSSSSSSHDEPGRFMDRASVHRATSFHGAYESGSVSNGSTPTDVLPSTRAISSANHRTVGSSMEASWEREDHDDDGSDCHSSSSRVTTFSIANPLSSQSTGRSVETSTSNLGPNGNHDMNGSFHCNFSPRRSVFPMPSENSALPPRSPPQLSPRSLHGQQQTKSPRSVRPTTPSSTIVHSKNFSERLRELSLAADVLP